MPTVLARRLLLSTAGPASVAAANFFVSVLLLQAVPAADFGLYAFAQVLVTSIGYGVSNATLGSPLMIALNRDETVAERTGESFAFVNALLSGAGALVLFLVLSALGLTPGTAAVFAASALLLWIRWFGRAFGYARHSPVRVMGSDIAYGAFLLVGTSAAWIAGDLDLEVAAIIQLAAAFMGLIAIGGEILGVAVLGVPSGLTAPFRKGFKRHGRHALVGLVSSEATANAHVYIVTFLLGPAAFAPLAAAALFFRPISVILHSLTQLERPALASMLKEGNRRSAWHTVSIIRATALATWAMTTLSTWVIVQWFLNSLVNEPQHAGAIVSAATLWGLIFAVQCLRGPEFALAQADGLFRPLSKTTVRAALITLPLVTLLTYTHGAVASLWGVLVGELVATTGTIILVRRAVVVA